MLSFFGKARILRCWLNGAFGVGLALLFGTFALPAPSFAYDASSAYYCGNGGDFPMTFAGCRAGYYYEDWQNADDSITPDEVGECIECPNGFTCAGGFAGPTQGSPCATGYYGATAGSCTACTNKPEHSTYTGNAATNNCPWTCDSGYFESNGSCITCSEDQIFLNGTCQTAHFSVTTTNDTDAFGFYMSAAGTFYIDWGDGTIQTITRTNNTDYTKYEHEYNSTGEYIVRFFGTATGYNSDGVPTIIFNEEAACYDNCEGNWSGNIVSISGSLSALFPMFGTDEGRYPIFESTFAGCTGLTSIPADLFSGITTGANYMFYNTFSGCTGLTSIPAGLFGGITTGANYMFKSTFYGCTGLTSIPAGLFGGITTGAEGMFTNTFYHCMGLTSIPADLFSGITTGANYMFQYTFSSCAGLTSIPAGLFSGITTGAQNMFKSTFYGCTGLTSIPADLFGGITTGANYMFYNTFYACTGLTSIPAGLFGGITTGAERMFYNTFSGCRGLTSIPAGLFGGITTGANYMFYNTFAACTNIRGYIPKSTFAGLVTAGSPTATGMWTNVFSNTNLSSECPSGTAVIDTTYKGTPIGTKWGNYAMCEELMCTPGKYIDVHVCSTCPENSYCTGGSAAVVSCPNGTYSPTGASDAGQCGRILNIGDDVVYLRSTKATSPALHIDTDHDGIADFFGNMTTADVVMHAGSERKFKVKRGNITYSVYDDTVTVP